MVLWRTVEPLERIWCFRGQLNLLNGYDDLEDSCAC